MAPVLVGPKYSVSNLARGLDVLELLLNHPGGLGVSDIAELLEIPKNAAFRVTTALWERGYLLRNDDNKTFRLSPKLMTMGYKAADRQGLIERSIPFMRQLRDSLKETVVLCALAENDGVVLEQVPGLYPFRFVVDPGSTFHLHTSAQGKALLAFLPPATQSELIEKIRFTRYNERTIASKQALLAELEKVRRLGYGIDHAEELDGVHCCAAALLDARGYPVAAISTTGPAQRFTESMFETVGRQMRECAEKISQTLGLTEN
ncbi:MAG TPA: IclR family transcriptional regulator [Planctomycetota bacterium]|jgi:DNA-binding IclR family transcriptional regulator